MRRRVLAIAVLAVAATGLALASASTLGVSAVGASSQNLQQPCAGSATATAVGLVDVAAGQPGYGGISVTLPQGCSGAHPVQITLLAGGATVVSGAGSVTGTATLSTSAYFAQTVTSAVATVDGWNLAVTWAFTPPATCQVTSGSGSCIAAVTMWTGTRTGGSSSALYFDVWVTTTSTSWVTWTVTFDLSNPYYGTTVTALGNSDLDDYWDGNVHFSSSTPINDVHRVGACSTTLVVTGDGNGIVNKKTSTNIRNFSLVRDDHARYFSLVVNRTETGYYDVYSPGC
jgi:hypothetical protein